MPPKKNAFMFFIDDYIKNYELKTGHSYPHGYKGAISDPQVSKAWADTSPEIKKKYREKEKKEKLKVEPEKLTCTGELMTLAVKREKEKQKFFINMMNYLSDIVQNDKLNLDFYVVHMNYHYKKPIDDYDSLYCPAEIGVAQFSLVDGIKRTYHLLLGPEVAAGFYNDARERSNEIHQIPAEKFEKDLNVAYESIVKFLEPSIVDGKFPIMYTMYKDRIDCDKETIDSIFKQLIAAHEEAMGAGASNLHSEFVVYSLEYLAAHLLDTNDVFMEPYFDKDPYDITSSLLCDFHRNINVGKYCSLSVVQRWIFAIFNAYNDKNSLKLIPGKHYPVEEFAPERERITQSFPSERDSQWNIKNNRPKSRVTKNQNQNQTQTTSITTGDLWQNSSVRGHEEEQRRREEAAARTLAISFQGMNVNADQQNNQQSPSTNNSSVLNEEEFPGLGSRPANRRPRQKNSPKNWAATLKK